MLHLSVKNLYVAYGDLIAVKNVSFSVNKGEVTALLGANGAGKSSIARCISGLLVPKSGSILFRDKVIMGLKPHVITRLGIAHVPEGRRLFPNLTVKENLVVSYIARNPKNNLKETLTYVLELFPRLQEREKQHAGTLSGGEQQMLAIGRGLMGEPLLLILDEPSLGLSPLLVKNVFEQLKVIKKREASILLVEQNVSCMDLATRGLVLSNGEVVFEGDSDALRDSDYVRRAYLGL